MYDVIIVGAGPAGIFAALELVKNGSKVPRILMLEKGLDVEKRNCPSREAGGGCRYCKPCNALCGWGGAGAFSDGKLTLSAQVGGSLEEYVGEERLAALIREVDEVYLRFGAPETLYGVAQEEEIRQIERRALQAELKLVPIPIRHMGTGRCRDILRRMRDYLLARGVTIRTCRPVAGFIVGDRTVVGVRTVDGEEIAARFVVVAPGREGASWLVGEAARLGLETAVNPVDIGVRVELPAVTMDHLTRVCYESKFIYYSKTFHDKVRTFCMNPYGEVVMENNDGLITVNGHSHAYRKTSNTNFSVLVSKTFTEPFRDPIAYGRYVASLANLLGGGVIVQRLGDLLAGRRSTPERLAKGLVTPTLREATPGDLSLVFPHRHMVAIVEMLQALDRVAPGVCSRYTLLYGVEVKFYSCRLMLTAHLETQVANLFAVGDGAGITRGLAQASASGMVAAREIRKRLEEG